MSSTAVDEELYTRFPSLKRVESVDRASLRLSALRLLPKNKVGAELGVFAGRFSQTLFSTLQPSKFYMVDGWELVFGPTWPSWGQYNDDGKLTPEMARLSAIARSKSFGDGSEVVISRTVDWLKTMPSGSLDWVYSDSGHTYDNTLAELKELARVLAPDGIIAGDDCQIDSAHRHHSVFRAIRDFCRLAAFEVIYMDHAKQWAIRRSAT